MKCKELGKKYDITAMQVGRTRKRFFPEHNGGELNDEEIDVLSEYFDGLTEIDERKAMEEAVKPKFVDATITYVKVGQRRVECHIRESKKRVIALMPSSGRKEMILRNIKLEEVEYEGDKFYRCATLAGRAWS